MLKRILRSLHFLTFLNGFLLASLIYFRMEANYERELFSAIQSNIDGQIDLNDDQDSIIVKVMHACNSLMVNRTSIFKNQNFDGFKADYMHPTSIDLMTGRGACGSYSMVLARILENYHFAVRIAQMKANGTYAAHNVVEAKTSKGWVVLDPFFDVYFINPSSKLASFEDVKNNWSFFSKQVPKGYDPKYKYEGVRYSNWGKIPILLPAVKKLLDLTMGKENADTFCMRIYFLRIYDFYFWLLLILYFPMFLYTLKRFIKQGLFPSRDIPLTPMNIAHFLKMRISGKSGVAPMLREHSIPTYPSSRKT